MPVLSADRLTGLFYCLICLICWGVAPIIYRFCGDKYTPAKMQALRSLAFVATGAAIFALTPGSIKFWPGWTDAVIMNVLTYFGLGLGDTLYFQCISKIGAGKAAALANTYPIYVAFMSAFVLGESLSLMSLFSIAVIIAGLMLVCLFKAGTNTAAINARSVRSGILLGIGAGFCWSLGVVVVPWIQQKAGLQPAATTLWRSIMLCTVSWHTYLLERHAKHDTTPIIPLREPECWLMFVAGLFVLGLANWFVARAMLLLSPSIVSPITGSSPMVAALLGYVLFKERISAIQWLGIVLIIAGGIAISVL